MSEQNESKKIINEEDLEKVTGGGNPGDTTYGLYYCICSDCHRGKLYLENPTDFVCPVCGSHRCVSFLYG